MRTSLLILSLIIVFTSCDTYRHAYSPSAHNIPILAKSGDSKIAANYSTNAPSRASEGGFDTIRNRHAENHANGYDLQGALAITDHIAVSAAYYHRDDITYTSYTDYYDTSTIRVKRDLFEVGVGFFTAIDRKKHMLLQVFLGGGLGEMNLKEHGLDDNLDPFSRYFKARLLKFYVQPAITFRVKEIFAASVTTRISAVQFGNISSNYTEGEKESFRLKDIDQSLVIFFEPAVICSFGVNSLPGLRPEFQLGLSAGSAGFIRSRFFNFSIGLNVDIEKLIKGRTR